MFLDDRICLAEAVEGGSSPVVAVLHSCRLTIITRDNDLLLQPHHWLEEVVVEPRSVVEVVQSQGLGDGVETLVAQVSTNQGRVPLFDEAVVVLVVRSAAGEPHPLDPLLPEAEHVIIEELATVVRMHL